MFKIMQFIYQYQSILMYLCYISQVIYNNPSLFNRVSIIIRPSSINPTFSCIHLKSVNSLLHSLALLINPQSCLYYTINIVRAILFIALLPPCYCRETRTKRTFSCRTWAFPGLLACSNVILSIYHCRKHSKVYMMLFLIIALKSNL